MKEARSAPGMPIKAGSFEYLYLDGRTGKPVPIFCHVPEGLLESAPLVFALSGEKRPAAEYRDALGAEAETKGFIVLAPLFDKEHFPGSRDYQFGGVVEEASGGMAAAYVEGAEGNLSIRPAELWTFALLERIFEDFVRRTGISRESYMIYGHSAGAQFAHRFLLLQRPSRVSYIVAANAGWYLELDAALPWPQGLGGIEGLVDKGDLRRYLEFPLLLLLGDADSSPNPQFADNVAAQRQGASRFERGKAYFEGCRHLAIRMGADFAWRLVVVPGVGHNNREMTIPAAELIAARFRMNQH